MSSWALAFLIVALLAALLGFSGIVGPASWIAKFCFALFLAAFLASVTSNRKHHAKGERSTKGLRQIFPHRKGFVSRIRCTSAGFLGEVCCI
jgi:uncharacterized membrane protein YtjA (UPF0391 family)